MKNKLSLLGVLFLLLLVGCNAQSSSDASVEANGNVEIASMEWTEEELRKIDSKVNSVDSKTRELEIKINSLKEKVGQAATPIFKDVPTTHWAYQEIMTLYSDGIISGYPDVQMFYPERSITRYQAASMLIKEFNLPLSDTPSIFTDIPQGSWAEKVAMTAYEAGFFTGSNGRFMPTEPMKRSHMAIVLQRAFDLEEVPGATHQNFHDVPVGFPGYNAIKVLSQHKITVVSNGYFRPDEPTLRSHFSAFMYRARN